jgi:hypothetical protein
MEGIHASADSVMDAFALEYLGEGSPQENVEKAAAAGAHLLLRRRVQELQHRAVLMAAAETLILALVPFSRCDGWASWLWAMIGALLGLLGLIRVNLAAYSVGRLSHVRQLAERVATDDAVEVHRITA